MHRGLGHLDVLCECMDHRALDDHPDSLCVATESIVRATTSFVYDQLYGEAALA